jgi:hypothetical protein
MNHADLARLRPMMPLDALAQLVGKDWAPPSPKSQGYAVSLWEEWGFAARIDVSGRIGWVAFHHENPPFHGGFPPHLVIERLRIGMTIEQALAARPHLRLVEIGSLGICRYADRTEAGEEICAFFTEGVLTSVTVERGGLVYPPPFKPFTGPQPTKVFDLSLEAPRALCRTNRGEAWQHGWCYGFPPGISPDQWPLSPTRGHPMRHAFTLRLPEQYRTRGPELVALSFFIGYFHWEYSDSKPLMEFMTVPLPDVAPRDEALLPFWRHRRLRHPLHYAMADTIDTDYAAIWLTQAEFDGALCSPPNLDGNPLLAKGPPPDWLGQGYEADGGLATASPISISERLGDPNVGKPPTEAQWNEECADNGYIRAYRDVERAIHLKKFFGRTHLGGTLFTGQGLPDIGPYYLELHEEFGGFNFAGDGEGWLDLEQMTFGWSR